MSKLYVCSLGMQLVACNLPIELYSVPWMKGMPSWHGLMYCHTFIRKMQFVESSIIMEFGSRDQGVDLSGFPMIISNSVICA